VSRTVAQKCSRAIEDDGKAMRKLAPQLIFCVGGGLDYLSCSRAQGERERERLLRQ